ncbi:MAG: NAD(P)-dependent oxidoreductase [Ignavibacteria bacterium]|nr:NAD(P)-dependent oxidoreductase [Ignavibacteria bacterium]
MKIFLAGATGVISRRLLPLLIHSGHEVTAMTRSQDHTNQIREYGGKPVVCNVFDKEKLYEAVVAAKPDVLIHQLTNIPRRINPRRVNKELAATNRLRAEGTTILLEAARLASARRFIAQSVAFAYGPSGQSKAVEEEPLYLDCPSAVADLVQAISKLESAVPGVPGIQGIVLRYGYFYGPGTIYATDGSFAEDVGRRRIPIVGNGQGIFSFIHVDDAAAATVIALDRGEPGIYNIVDDDPAPVGEWLPLYAELLKAPPPFRVPKFIGRLAAGPYGSYLMTEQRGASNDKAKKHLGWTPRFSTWRDGFRLELAPQT